MTIYNKEQFARQFIDYEKECAYKYIADNNKDEYTVDDIVNVLREYREKRLKNLKIVLDKSE